MTTDLSTETQAKRSLNESSYLDLRTVSVSYESGTVMLRGAVPTYFLKQLAQEFVGRVDGVHRIVNDIEVSD